MKFGHTLCTICSLALGLNPLLVFAEVTDLPIVAPSTSPPKNDLWGVTPKANTISLPTQILKTGINLNSNGISLNSLQLSNAIGLTPILERIQNLRSKKASQRAEVTLESLATRQDLNDALIDAHQLIQKTSLEVDFVMSEVEAEQNVYEEILNSYQNARDHAVAKTNAAAFITNGALWAVAEGFTIPTYKYPNYAIPSGINGIIAGLVPSFFSMWAMKQVAGEKNKSENDPNILAKLFDYPITPDIDYPSSVWQFLQTIPPGQLSGKTRREQLIDRWISDDNLPDFTDPKSRKQIDVITASISHRKSLTISTLNTRLVMLKQLEGEVLKMKRMLLELNMVARGEKTI
ncbi:hypothetical protein BH11CYA1_BH11CYA1_18390 [soil metagenome]